MVCYGICGVWGISRFQVRMFIEQLEYGTLERIHSQRHWFKSYTRVFEENICGGRHSYWGDKLKGNACISSVYVEKWFSVWLIGKGERSLKNEVILVSNAAEM